MTGMRATQSQRRWTSFQGNTCENRKGCKSATEPHTGQLKQTAGGAVPWPRLEYRLVCNGNVFYLTPDLLPQPPAQLVTPRFLPPPTNPQPLKDTGSTGNVVEKVWHPNFSCQHFPQLTLFSKGQNLFIYFFKRDYICQVLQLM